MKLSYTDALLAVQEHYGYLSSELHKGIDSDKKWVHSDDIVYPTQRAKHSIHLTVGELRIGSLPDSNGDVETIEFVYGLLSPRIYALMRNHTVVTTFNFSNVKPNQFKAKLKASIDLLLSRIRVQTDSRLVNGRLMLPNMDYHMDVAVHEMRTMLYTINKDTNAIELQKAQALFEEFTAVLKDYNISTQNNVMRTTHLGII